MFLFSYETILYYFSEDKTMDDKLMQCPITKKQIIYLQIKTVLWKSLNTASWYNAIKILIEEQFYKTFTSHDNYYYF